MSEEPQQKGKISGLVTAFKKLLAEDPLLFIIAITCLAPLGIGIVSTALEGDYMLVAILVVTMAAVILLIVLPLIITRTWKINQREISSRQKDAIDTEAKIRLINAKNKQKRFNDVTDAKIEALKAQTQFILDQSDRHERVLLKQISEDLGKHFKEGLPFVDQAECATTVSNLLQEFNKVHIDYDEVFASIARIEKALKIVREDPPAVKIVEDPNKANWEKIASVRQNIIEDQLKEIVDLVANNESQAAAIRKMEAELHPLYKPEKIPPGVLVDPVSPSHIGFVEEPTSTEQELKAAVESIESLKDETVDEPLSATIEEEIDKHLSELEKTDSKRMMAEGLIALAPQEEETIKNWWTCKYCNNDNPLKAPRCKKCGKGKVQPS